jgi:hypothetical protein
MTMFNRRMQKGAEFDENGCYHYDCDACLWPGADLPAGSEEQASEAFAAHKCGSWVNAKEIQGRLSAF